MKPIKYILATAVAGSVLFTGCTKDSMPGSDLTAMNESTLAGSAGITYRLQTKLPQQGALLQWQNGYMAVREITMSGVGHYGDELKPVTFNVIEAPKMIDNIFGNEILGTVQVSQGYYSSMSTSFLIAHTLDATNALVLNGTYTGLRNVTSLAARSIALGQIPVSVVITSPITLHCAPVSSLTVKAPGNTITVSLDMAAVTNGIDAGMLNSAVSVDGTILISSTTNTALYNIIVANLENNLMTTYVPDPMATSVVTSLP